LSLSARNSRKRSVRADCFLFVEYPPSLRLRREQCVNESTDDDRNGDHDEDAQRDQEGERPIRQLAARARAHPRGRELLGFKSADQRGIVRHRNSSHLGARFAKAVIKPQSAPTTADGADCRADV
jgi:hypothetical protein